MVGLANKVDVIWQKASLVALQKNSIADSLAHLQHWQQTELMRFLAVGFPTRKNEAWKYTSLASLVQQTFTMQQQSDRSHLPARPAIETLSPPAVYQVVFIDGSFVMSLSHLDNLPAGVEISDLQTALKHKKIDEYLLIEKAHSDALTSLNAALLSNGLYLRVPAGVVLDKPLHLLYISTDTDVSLMNHPRHLIIAEEHSSVSLLEEYVGARSCYFNNVVTQIYAGSQAVVEHYKLQRESQSAFHIANTYVHQKRDSSVATFHFSLGAGLARDYLQYVLDEPGVTCQMIGFYHAKNNQHVDQHTHVDHRVPHTSSEQLYKGIVSDKGRAVFNGKIIVHPDAQKTTAHQSNKNLLLSKQAEVYTKPELEIYADDVKCSHGAVIGQLDATALFYLQSRGISEARAQQMLTGAFSAEILSKVPNVLIANHLKQSVEHCLNANEGNADE